MKQIVLEAPGRFVEREVAISTAAAGEALIRMERVGICGSDFHAFVGRHPVYTYPRVIGHELSGVIAEVPANNFGLKHGDRCAIEPYLSCGQCRACVQKRNNCCEQLRVLGIHVDGGMQEYLAVPVALLHKSERLSLDQLALVETLGIGAHAVNRSALKAGQEALIVGAGPIGIAVAQFASATGAKVYIAEKREWRRQFVKQMGYAAIEAVDDYKADVVFDATGDAVTMGSSLDHVAAGGTLVFVGLSTEPVCIDDSLFHRREITLLASRNSNGLFPQIIRQIEEGKIDTMHWITDRLTLVEVASQFEDLLRRPTLIKTVVEIQDWQS